MKMKIQHEYLWDAVKKVIREQCKCWHYKKERSKMNSLSFYLKNLKKEIWKQNREEIKNLKK